MLFVFFVLECGTVISEVVLDHYTHVGGIEFELLLALQGFMGVELALQFYMFVLCSCVSEEATSNVFLVKRFLPIGFQQSSERLCMKVVS